MIFEIMTACRSQHKHVGRQPHGKICAKSGVTEIELRRFRKTLHCIVGIRCKEIYDAQSLKYPKPFFGGRLRDISRFGKSRIIDLLGNKRRASAQKSPEPYRIGDPACFGNVTHEICVYVRIEVFLTQLVVNALNLRHTAFPYFAEGFEHIVFRELFLPFCQRFKRKIKPVFKCDAVFFVR